MRLYTIKRIVDDQTRLNDVICIVHENGSLDYGLEHIVYHSPDGFEYGYNGSGPADLALSILADYFMEQQLVKFELQSKWQPCPDCPQVAVGDTQEYWADCDTCDGSGEIELKTRSLELHQQFKRDWIATIPQNRLLSEITSDQIQDWLYKISKEQETHD